MKKTSFILVFLLASALCHARSRTIKKTSVGVFIVKHEASSTWLAEDEALFSSLTHSLESRNTRILKLKDFESFFQDPPDPKLGELSASALAHLKQGHRLSTGLKPKLAIKEFTEALRELRAVFPYLKDLTALEQAHLERGMTYQALGDDALARQEYRMVLLLNPNRKLDDAVVSPVVMESFESVRKNLLTSLRGSVSVISNPPAASLTMDGRDVGRTPITVSGVIPGEHYFSLKHPGYKVWFGVLKVKDGAMEKQEVFLAEGSSIKNWRLLRKIASLGATKNELGLLLKGLGLDQLLLFEFDHLGGKTLLKLTAGLDEQAPLALGVFPLDGVGLEVLVKKLRSWLAGDRSELLSSSVIVGDGRKGDQEDKHPVVTERKWYEQWWVWTIAGVVVAGAAAATTAVLVGGDSGIQIEVYR